MYPKIYFIQTLFDYHEQSGRLHLQIPLIVRLCSSHVHSVVPLCFSLNQNYYNVEMVSHVRANGKDKYDPGRIINKPIYIKVHVVRTFLTERNIIIYCR